jgi:hypothetical protein
MLCKKSAAVLHRIRSLVVVISFDSGAPEEARTFTTDQLGMVERLTGNNPGERTLFLERLRAWIEQILTRLSQGDLSPEWRNVHRKANTHEKPRKGLREMLAIRWE